MPDRPDLPLPVDAVLLDIDGTLLDSNYHHTVAWVRAFARLGCDVPAWVVHRHVGMGGDKLVAAVAGEAVERRHGDAVRSAWEQEYDALIDQTTLFPKARELLEALAGRGFTVVLASSSIPEHARHATQLLGEAGSAVDASTTAEDAEQTKPDPELLELALDRVHGSRAVLIGDTVWDVEAAQRAGVECVAVLSGGFGRAELADAGAVLVLRDVAEVLNRLDEVVALGRR